MGPDEHHTDVNNSIFTNVVAALSVYTARYATCLADLDEEDLVPDRWIKVVKELFFTSFNDGMGIHDEFDDFEANYDSSGFSLVVSYYGADTTFRLCKSMTWCVHNGQPFKWCELRSLRFGDKCLAASTFSSSHSSMISATQVTHTTHSGWINTVLFIWAIFKRHSKRVKVVELCTSTPNSLLYSIIKNVCVCIIA